MRLRRVVATARPCTRTNQECSITRTCATLSPRSAASAAASGGGAATSRERFMGSDGKGAATAAPPRDLSAGVHPAHTGAEAQRARRARADVFGEHLHPGVGEVVAHQRRPRCRTSAARTGPRRGARRCAPGGCAPRAPPRAAPRGSGRAAAARWRAWCRSRRRALRS